MLQRSAYILPSLRKLHLHEQGAIVGLRRAGDGTGCYNRIARAVMTAVVYASVSSVRRPSLKFLARGLCLCGTSNSNPSTVCSRALSFSTIRERASYSKIENLKPYLILQSRKMSSKRGDDRPSPPRPSSSVILVSPKNEILLLHRVQTSSSFPSAHVFPGGNLSTQDGNHPTVDDPTSHDDGPSYRHAAIRELFEESGILLAKDHSSGKLLAVKEEDREKGRRSIHANEITFDRWLKWQSSTAEPDTERLIPFTHWITPTNVPRRYTTQMYLYFLPLPQGSDKQILDEIPAEGKREEVHVPRSDGGIEITEAMFLPASEWLQKARRREIALFPPQFLLLHLASQFLDKERRGGDSVNGLGKRRSELVDFVYSGSPPWTHKYISPKLLKLSSDGRAVLSLDHPGWELDGTDRVGESDRVIPVRFKRGTVQDVDVWWKRDAFLEDKEEKSKL